LPTVQQQQQQQAQQRRPINNADSNTSNQQSATVGDRESEGGKEIGKSTVTNNQQQHQLAKVMHKLENCCLIFTYFYSDSTAIPPKQRPLPKRRTAAANGGLFVKKNSQRCKCNPFKLI
jgi:hypothetical protein